MNTDIQFYLLVAGFFGLPCCAAWACVTWRAELESICCGCRDDFKDGDDEDDSEDGGCSSDGDGGSLDDETKKRRGEDTDDDKASSAPTLEDGKDLETGRRKSLRRQSNENNRRKSGAGSSSSSRGGSQNGKETEETKDSFGGWEYSPAAASSRSKSDTNGNDSARARRNSKLSGGRKRVSSAAASLFRRESRVSKEEEPSSRPRPSLFLGPSPSSSSWVPHQASEGGVAGDIARLKGLLRADDDACAAEAAQLRRLSHAGWANQASTPALAPLMQAAKLTSHEFEASSLAAELTSRIEAAVQGHEDFMAKMEATNFVVDPTAFVQDGEYRAGCKAVASLVERFGLDNVQRVLETRRLASAQYNDQYNGDDNDYDDEDGDDDENEDDLYVRAASQAVEPLQRRSASTGVSSITYNSGQGTNHSSNSNSNSGKSGRRTSGSAGSGSNDNSSSHSHLSNELRVGDLVQWCQSDEDLPEGVVGEVVGFKLDSKGRRRATCKFPCAKTPFALLLDQLVREPRPRTSKPSSSSTLPQGADDAAASSSTSSCSSLAAAAAADAAAADVRASNVSMATISPADFFDASELEQLKWLQQLPVSVFLVDGRLTQVALWRATGQTAPHDAGTLLREALPHAKDKARLLAQLPPATAGLLLLELKLRGDYANVLDAYPAPRRASSKQRHSSSSSTRAAAAAANERSPARRAVEAWLKQLSNGSFSFTPAEGGLGLNHGGGGGGGGAAEDGGVEEDPPLPPGLSALPLELTWDLVSTGGSAASVAALLQGLKVSDSVSLLLEFHRRSAAGPILDYLGQTMPGGVAALLAQCLPVTAPSLLLAMGVAQECLPLDAQVACLGAMNRADRNETFEACTFHHPDERSTLEATLDRLDARKANKSAKAAERAKNRAQNGGSSGMHGDSSGGSRVHNQDEAGAAVAGNHSLRPPSPAADHHQSPPHYHQNQNQNRDSLAPSVRSSFAGSENGSSAGYGEYRLEDYDAVERLRTPSIQGNLAVERPLGRPRPLAGHGPRDSQSNSGDDDDILGDGLSYEDRLRYCDNSDEEADECELADLVELQKSGERRLSRTEKKRFSVLEAASRARRKSRSRAVRGGGLDAEDLEGLLEAQHWAHAQSGLPQPGQPGYREPAPVREDLGGWGPAQSSAIGLASGQRPRGNSGLQAQMAEGNEGEEDDDGADGLQRDVRRRTADGDDEDLHLSNNHFNHHDQKHHNRREGEGEEASFRHFSRRVDSERRAATSSSSGGGTAALTSKNAPSSSSELLKGGESQARRRREQEGEGGGEDDGEPSEEGDDSFLFGPTREEDMSPIAVNKHAPGGGGDHSMMVGVEDTSVMRLAMDDAPLDDLSALMGALNDGTADNNGNGNGGSGERDWGSPLYDPIAAAAASATRGRARAVDSKGKGGAGGRGERGGGGRGGRSGSGGRGGSGGRLRSPRVVGSAQASGAGEELPESKDTSSNNSSSSSSSSSSSAKGGGKGRGKGASGKGVAGKGGKGVAGQGSSSGGRGVSSTPHGASSSYASVIADLVSEAAATPKTARVPRFGPNGYETQQRKAAEAEAATSGSHAASFSQLEALALRESEDGSDDDDEDDVSNSAAEAAAADPEAAALELLMHAASGGGTTSIGGGSGSGGSGGGPISRGQSPSVRRRPHSRSPARSHNSSSKSPRARRPLPGTAAAAPRANASGRFQEEDEGNRAMEPPSSPPASPPNSHAKNNNLPPRPTQPPPSHPPGSNSHNSSSGGGRIADCDLGHGLEEFLTPEDGWYCSCCHDIDPNCERFGPNHRMYGCRECDYDVCVNCWAAPPRGTPSSPVAAAAAAAATLPPQERARRDTAGALSGRGGCVGAMDETSLMENTLSPLSEGTAATEGAQQARAAAAAARAGIGAGSAKPSLRKSINAGENLNYAAFSEENLARRSATPSSRSHSSGRSPKGVASLDPSSGMVPAQPPPPPPDASGGSSSSRESRTRKGRAGRMRKRGQSPRQTHDGVEAF